MDQGLGKLETPRGGTSASGSSVVVSSIPTNEHPPRVSRSGADMTVCRRQDRRARHAKSHVLYHSTVQYTSSPNTSTNRCRFDVISRRNSAIPVSTSPIREACRSRYGCSSPLCWLKEWRRPGSGSDRGLGPEPVTHSPLIDQDHAHRKDEETLQP